MRTEETMVPPEMADNRLDSFLSSWLQQSRSAVQGWIEQGAVAVDGRVRPKN